MQKNRTQFTHRFLALFLCLALGLPSSSFALKPPETPESAGLEQLSQALTPSAGLEEGRFGLTARDIQGLSVYLRIPIPKVETPEAINGLMEQVSELIAERLGPHTEEFAESVLEKLTARKIHLLAKKLGARPPPAPSQRLSRRVVWALAAYLGIAAIPSAVYLLQERKPKPPAPVRPIDSVKGIITQTVVGPIEIAMMPGALRAKLPPRFAGKPVLGFLRTRSQPEFKISGSMFWFVPAEKVIAPNGVINFKAPPSVEGASGYNWPEARQRLLVVFDSPQAAKEMAKQMRENVSPDPPEKFQGILLFLSIRKDGAVEVLRSGAGLEEPRAAQVRREIQRQPPTLSGGGAYPVRFETGIIQSRTPEKHVLEAENGQVWVHLHVFEGRAPKHGLLFRLKLDDAGKIRGVGEVLVESLSHKGSSAYNEFVVLDQVEGLPERAQEQLQEAGFRAIQDRREELQAALDKMKSGTWKPLFVLARSVSPEEPGLSLMVRRKWLRPDQRFFMHPLGIVYERQDRIGPITPGQQGELEGLLAASAEVKEAGSQNNPKPYFDALIRQLFAGRNVSIAMRGEMKSSDGLHELVLVDGDDPNNWTGLLADFVPAPAPNRWFVYLQEWRHGRKQENTPTVSYMNGVTVFQDRVRTLSGKILREAGNPSVVAKQENAQKILEAVSSSGKSGLEEANGETARWLKKLSAAWGKASGFSERREDFGFQEELSDLLEAVRRRKRVGEFQGQVESFAAQHSLTNKQQVALWGTVTEVLWDSKAREEALGVFLEKIPPEDFSENWKALLRVVLGTMTLEVWETLENKRTLPAQKLLKKASQVLQVREESFNQIPFLTEASRRDLYISALFSWTLVEYFRRDFSSARRLHGRLSKVLADDKGSLEAAIRTALDLEGWISGEISRKQVEKDIAEWGRIHVSGAVIRPDILALTERLFDRLREAARTQPAARQWAKQINAIDDRWRDLSGLEEMQAENELITGLPMTFPKWMEQDRETHWASKVVRSADSIERWERFERDSNPRRRRFFSQLEKQYALWLSSLGLEKLMEEAGRLRLEWQSPNDLPERLLGDAGWSAYAHSVDKPLIGMKKEHEMLALAIAGERGDQQVIRSAIEKTEKQWAWVLENMHRWDNAPKFKSKVLFDNRMVVVDSSMIKQDSPLDKLLRQPGKLGEYQQRIVVLEPTVGKDWPGLLVAHSPSDLPEVIPDFKRRRAFLTLTFLGRSDTAEQIREVLSLDGNTGPTFLYDPKLANPDALNAFLLDGLGMPMDQAEALTAGMEEQSLVGRQA